MTGCGGRLAYFLFGNVGRCCYVGFDVHEVLRCASYFLMRAFPDKKFLLNGEGELESASLANDDSILLPGTELAKLDDCSIDQFID